MTIHRPALSSGSPRLGERREHSPITHQYLATLDDGMNTLHSGDIGQWIAVDDDHIGEFAGASVPMSSAMPSASAASPVAPRRMSAAGICTPLTRNSIRSANSSILVPVDPGIAADHQLDARRMHAADGLVARFPEMPGWVRASRMSSARIRYQVAGMARLTISPLRTMSSTRRSS